MYITINYEMDGERKGGGDAASIRHPQREKDA